MFTFHIFVAMVSLFAASAIALPHDLMVNNELIRDVGVLYTDFNYTGEPLFLIQHKQEPKCEISIATRYTSRSAQICVPATCVLFMSADCTPSKAGEDYYFRGPMDVDSFPDKPFKSYICGTIEEMDARITASIVSSNEG